jgi:hypothetical protein
MKQVIYTGRKVPGKIRILRTQDLDQLGIKHKGEDLVWSPENRYNIVMSNQMSDSLVDKLPNEFAAYDADGEDESPEPEVAATSLESPAGSDEDPPEESPESVDDDSGSSTQKKSKNK